MRLPVLGRVLALVAALLTVSPVWAETRGDARAQAAQHYDQGVSHFERAEYAAAVESFLAADALVPSPDALASAIAAARRLNDHLLVARVAEKALERDNLPAELAAGAREALSQAARQLARMEANCAPAPCALELDGKPIAPGKHWLLPGAHQLAAETENGARAREQLMLVAGASYQATVRPLSGDTTLSQSSEPGTAEKNPPAASASTKAGKNGAARDPATPTREDARPLSPAVFYVGLGTTLALAIATTVSGIDTLSERDELSDRPTEADIDQVESRIRRTDLLLGGTLLVGLVTSYAGFVLVDWQGDARVEASFSAQPGGAELGLRGRF